VPYGRFFFIKYTYLSKPFQGSINDIRTLEKKRMEEKRLKSLSKSGV
jgi:hypothetical protein